MDVSLVCPVGTFIKLATGYGLQLIEFMEDNSEALI